MYREYRCEHLDLIRGCAALLVLAGHLRHFVFKDYVDLQQAGVPVGALARLFYFATSFQHQAVIVFFALSGFLVGGRIFGDICSDRFRWASYLARRLTRLWIVIVPALVLTEVFDALRPDGSPAGNASLVVFVGNLLFVQTILVPPLGNNLPLWSLANEYWYYLLGPVVVLLILGRSFYQFKLLGLAAIIVFCLSFPFSFVVGGIIWMAGALAAWAGRKYSTRPRPMRGWSRRNRTICGRPASFEVSFSGSSRCAHWERWSDRRLPRCCCCGGVAAYRFVAKYRRMVRPLDTGLSRYFVYSLFNALSFVDVRHSTNPRIYQTAP